MADELTPAHRLGGRRQSLVNRCLELSIIAGTECEALTQNQQAGTICSDDHISMIIAK
jgi:hypothetical protein